MNCVLSENVTVYSDSQSAIHLCKKFVFHERTKYIDVRLHFISDIVSQDIIRFEKVLSEYNPSDMRTKVLPLAKFRSYLTLLLLVKVCKISKLLGMFIVCHLCMCSCVLALLRIKVKICWVCVS